jgi:LPS-assembly lipoprotein
MHWRDRRGAKSRFTSRFAGWLAIAPLAVCLGGCFQPLYGDHPVDGRNGPSLHAALSTVDVKQIDAIKGSDEARLAVELRNDLLFGLTGGSDEARPAYTLVVKVSSTRSDIIVDTTTTRPSIENYGINATYILTEIASGKQVVTGQTFARVSYDIPGQEQRFARMRGLRDAESRAAKVIADNIRSRLASYFAAGT